ncbi:MAG: phosphotransferase family protein [Vulcanimicrobiaceae bacterium]
MSTRVDDTIDMRPGETLDLATLEPYLRDHLPVTDGAFSARQFATGHANLTYLVRFGESEYVLRRPPHGPLPKGGHDMAREFRVLSRLWEWFPLAPRAFHFCSDPAIVGADFVVMERRRGIVIGRTMPVAIASDPAAARRLGERFIDTLAALHRVDRTPFADLGRPEGYLERQLDGWIARWEAAQTTRMPDAATLFEALRATRPTSGPPALVHNDFKLENTIVAASDPTQPVAVLDWDMCTVGDPLADLGNVLSLWTEPGMEPEPGSSTMPTGSPGFPTRAELVARYAATTGRDCTRASWYEAFNIFRYAAIAQQIYARYVRGQTHDERFATFDTLTARLVERGDALVRSGAL